MFRDSVSTWSWYEDSVNEPLDYREAAEVPESSISFVLDTSIKYFERGSRIFLSKKERY